MSGQPAPSGPGGIPLEAPPLPAPVLFDQRWCELTFLHWPVEPTKVERFMPRGCVPDCLDGVSYVGLVLFAMRHAGLGSGLAVPYLGSFGEVNVRLYSRDAAGRHGVVFRSLDCSRLLVVAGARLGGFPYVWSHIRLERQAEDTYAYAVRRRGGPSEIASRVVVRAGAAIDPTPIELFLTARWGAHTRWRGRTLFIPNRHDPWPLHEAELLELADDLVQAAGITPCGPMLRPLWSPGVRARFGRPDLRRSTTRVRSCR